MELQDNKQLILRFIGWFFLINGLVFWLLGYQYLENILLSPALFKNSIAGCSNTGCEIFIVSFAIINYSAFMVLLAFIPGLFLWVFAYIVPYKYPIGLLSIVFATTNLLVLFIDKTIYAMFKFHLNGTLLSMLASWKSYDFFDFSAYEVYLFLGFSTLLLLFEIIIAYLVWNKIIIPERYKIGKTLARIWLLAFLSCYFILIYSISSGNNLLTQQTPNLPFYNQLIAYLIPEKNADDALYRFSENHFAQPHYSNNTMHYPLKPLLCEKPDNPPNIILIMVDSLRFDMLQKKYMPHLEQFSQKSWQFNNTISGGNCTQPGLFSLFYSLPPSYWTAASEQKIAPVFIQLLQKYGYTSEVLWSGMLENPSFDKTIYLGLKNIHRNQPPTDDVGYNDRRVTRYAIQFLESNKSHQPFFLNLFYDAAHGYCRQQSYPTPHQPAIKECVRISLLNDTDPLPYFNRYLNAVEFIDNELAKLFESIDKLGYLKNSLVIITSDHGQEFNDNKRNYWEHSSNYTDIQVHIPLVIHWPEESAQTFAYQTSSYDIIPTVLQKIFHCKNPLIDYSIGQNLLSDKDRLPFILSGSYTNLGLIEPDRLTTLRASGPIAITDKHAKPEPQASPRVENIKKALELMRMYYAK